jgi:DnaJ-class molecular chaperone
MNPYQVLGISSQADIKEIKQAYKKLCLKYHPDNGGNENKFHEVNQAYQMIMNGQVSSAVNKGVVVHSTLFKYRVIY